MNEVNLKEYLTCDSKEELTERLMNLDLSIMALHQNGFYVVNFDANNIKLYNGELNLASFNNKIDYLNSGINVDGDKKDILEMCAIGICAYNDFSSFYTNKEFLAYLIANFETFVNDKKIPKEIANYYHSVLIDGNIDYLNNYIFKKNNENASNSQVSSNSYRLSKSTAIGRSFVDKEAAFVNVLLIPAVLVLIYLVFLVVTMLF